MSYNLDLIFNENLLPYLEIATKILDISVSCKSQKIIWVMKNPRTEITMDQKPTSQPNFP